MRARVTVTAGVLAAAASMVASEGLSALLDLRESPVVSVGQSVIALTPGPIAHAIIEVVGTKDKPLAVASVVVAILLLGAVVGRWWLTRRLAAFALVSLLVVLAAAAVLTRPYASPQGVFAAVAGGFVLVAVLQLLLAPRANAHAAPDASRRTFIRTAALIAVATAVVGGAGQALASRRRRRQTVERARAALRIPARPVEVPAGADLQVAGQQPWLTSNRDFYRIDTALQAPLIDPSEWRLRITGMVDRELTLSYQDLLDRGLTDAWITICCVSNVVGGELIGNTVWGGVPIKSILDEVGIRPGADALLSTSEDGWTCGTPLDALTDGRDALLALTMNGEPLPVPHGFPVRQVVPGLYGYVSATKWVTEWKVTRFDDFEAFWTQRGWGERGPIKTESRIDVPRDGGTVDAGTVTVAGVAWAQHTGVEGVEFRVDGGPWQKARLGAAPSVDTWVQWTADWDAEPGDHAIEARATDATGKPQTDAVADVLPDGATGYPRISVRVS
ncbi:molybdopterin-dependent oxidoreductase [Aeromicrobium endophyticum]|uniref:molybdopterin-dependent oxidoreductase n=1 Tax=Aeromicrobium endophyticum TaxID=2292704 RepID=UPI001F15B831|nr:molybdopterin-dependent oxidoreductase [Aeromicrobium endophyticum]